MLIVLDGTENSYVKASMEHDHFLTLQLGLKAGMKEMKGETRNQAT